MNDTAAKPDATKDRVIEAGRALAREVTHSIAFNAPLDRAVLRHWANKFHEAHREMVTTSAARNTESTDE